MSTYGPPGGPYPGQPQDPWQTASQPHEPYGQSGQATDAHGQPVGADVWGVSGPPGGPESVSPGYGEGYPPGPGLGGPEPAGRRKGAGPLITVIVALSLLLCGGGIGAIYLIYNGGGANEPEPNPSISEPVRDPEPLGKDDDAPTVKSGDCIVNGGTETKPVLRRVPCAANTFEVLRRIDGTSDTSRCSNVVGHTHEYWIKVGNVESSSFVLCVKLLITSPNSKK